MSAILALAVAAAVSGSISGDVSYRERMAVPANAVLTVSLDRFSKDAQTNVSEVRIRLNGKQVPVNYSLPYFGIDPKDKYGVRATIQVGNQTLFESPSHVMVRPGAKRLYPLVLTRALAANPWPLTDRTWTLFSLEGQTVTGRAPSLKFDAKGGAFGGNTGVNTFGGTYIWNAPHVQLDPGAMTMMAGSEEAMARERNFLRVLTQSNRLAIEEGVLHLYRGNRTLASFKSTPLR